MTLKNVSFYWALILLPMIALAIGLYNYHLKPESFFLLLIVYGFIFRPWTDGTRLYYGGKITSKERLLFFIPFRMIFIRNEYFSFLYFDK